MNTPYSPRTASHTVRNAQQQVLLLKQRGYKEVFMSLKLHVKNPIKF